MPPKKNKNNEHVTGNSRSTRSAPVKITAPLNVVFNENDETSEERPKPAAVKNKNKILKPINKSEEKKGKIKPSTKEDAREKIPMKAKVAQVRNLRKRCYAEPAVEESVQSTKFLKSCVKGTQVTPEMIDGDEELFEINNQHSNGQALYKILKNKKLNKSDKAVIYIKPKIKSNKVRETNVRDQSTGKTFDRKHRQLGDIIIISSDEEH